MDCKACVCKGGRVRFPGERAENWGLGTGRNLLEKMAAELD